MIRREIWHVTEGLIFAHFAVFLLTQANPDKAGLLVFQPQLLLQRPWSILSFQFLHGGMISFFFSMIVLWIMGKSLEVSWGSARFLIFWAISVLGATGTAFLFGQPLVGDIFLATSLLFTYATLNPDVEFLMFLIIPMKVKWLALIGGAFLIFGSLRLGLFAGIANIVGMSAGYAFFLATRNLPSKRRIAHKLKEKRTERQMQVESSRAEDRNLTWDPPVKAAVERAKAAGSIDGESEALLQVLDQAVDPSVTVCAAGDFNYVDDPVCSACTGYAECAARRIRMTAEGEI